MSIKHKLKNYRFFVLTHKFNDDLEIYGKTTDKSVDELLRKMIVHHILRKKFFFKKYPQDYCKIQKELVKHNIYLWEIKELKYLENITKYRANEVVRNYRNSPDRHSWERYGWEWFRDGVRFVFFGIIYIVVKSS
jgi:hypothetical protein